MENKKNYEKIKIACEKKYKNNYKKK